MWDSPGPHGRGQAQAKSRQGSEESPSTVKPERSGLTALVAFLTLPQGVGGACRALRLPADSWEVRKPGKELEASAVILLQT